MSGHSDDIRFVERVLAGDEGAAAEFQERYASMLLGNVSARCADARSRARAEEIAGEVLTDCFGASGKEPLLASYHGRAPLENWLSTIAINRLKNWWRSGRWKYESPESHLSDDDGDGPGVIASARDLKEVAEDPDAAELLCEALLAAFKDVKPRDLVFLRLVHLGGIKRVQLAKLWDVDPATVGRRMEDAVGGIRDGVLAFLKRMDPEFEITWNDCLSICAKFPKVLLGDRPGEEEGENPVKA